MPAAGIRTLVKVSAASLLIGVLSGCTMLATQGVRSLNFRAGQELTRIDPQRLLIDQRLPAGRILPLREALRRAPLGSVVLACWRGTNATNFWGPCSHISRKLSDTELAETIGITEGGADIYPISRLYSRYAVIVIDAGVRAEHLPALRAEAQRLRGLPYDLSNAEGTYYCSNYQNQLQRAMNLPDVVPFNSRLKMYVPAEALLIPGTRVLWVGVNPASPNS